MSKNETVNELFELAIELEKDAESLYHRFAKMFAHEKDVADFWRKYADEERGHAAFLERIRSRLTEETLSAPGDNSMLKSVHKGIKNSVNYQLQTIQTLEDAFQLAMELENSETNAIFEFIITSFSAEELVKSHGFLRTQLKKHCNMLTDDFPTRFKSKLMRMKVNAPGMEKQ